MASLVITFTISGQSVDRTINFPDARATDFLDDLIRNYGDDTPPLTRTEAGQRFVNEVGDKQKAWAKVLEQQRLDLTKSIAIDLEDN